jgi:beta-lactamase class A
MTYQVRVAGNITNVKVSTTNQKIRTTVLSNQIMARNLSELLDVDVSGVGDKFVIMYNASTGKYSAVNPDEVLSAAAVTETTAVGLPQNFIDTLDVDLDDKIDVDGGSF